MNEPLISEILSLSAQLPTGLTDAKALEKYHREKEELHEAMAEALLEAADCAYYAIKAWHNGLVDEAQREAMIKAAADTVGVTPWLVMKAAIAKYTLRARPGNPKDKVAERMAASELLK